MSIAVNAVSLLGAGVGGLGLGALLVRRARPASGSDATDRAAAATLAAVETLAATSAQQATAMRALAEMTAQSMRSATGTYVFQLRDRFDEQLPTVAIGVADHTWRARPATHPSLAAVPAPASSGDALPASVDGYELSAFDQVDQLVFHPGDRVEVTARFVCNQAPVRRSLDVVVTSASPEAVVGPPRCRSVVRAGAGGWFDVAPDVSAFVELPIELEVGSLAHGSLEAVVTGRFDVRNQRPEGAIAHVPFRVVIRAIVVPDEDGNGLDLPLVEAVVDPEHRSYWLDKDEQVELTLAAPSPAMR